MNAAAELFRTLREFKSNPEPGKTPQQSLTDFCQNTLGGIERTHFDFKTKANPATTSFDDSDKKNLSKATSGFANEAGGVIIWGISDGTIAPAPIVSVSKFVDSVLQLCHQLTSPAVSGIDGDFILADSSSHDGFALIYIPESDLPPHRVLLSVADVKDHYYRRSGSSFVRASHSQLEDMFGRRPRPNLIVEFEKNRRSAQNEVWLTAVLTNVGRGIARYPYLNIELENPFGISEFGIDGNGRFGLPVLARTGGFRHDQYSIMKYRSMKFGSQAGIVVQSGMRHPITQVIASSISLREGEPLTLRAKYSVAAEGLPLGEREIQLEREEIFQLPRAAEN